MRQEPLNDAARLAALADEVESGAGPVELTRAGHAPVVLVSAEDWHRFEELESAAETSWWRQDAAGRAVAGEPAGDGEDGPGMDETAFRREFAGLFRHDTTA
ncbi:MAG: type II toxin-antitoxin system Phd/YefM family antitoxin [Pseudonocardia sp.]|nr:type II toxin-antitoxin system Phd/YefM family antitoxin [Pseudonocardia sp.]